MKTTETTKATALKAEADIIMNKEGDTTMQSNTIITHTDYELEVMRHDVTPGQFLAYVRARAKAKDLYLYVMSAKDFAKNDEWVINYDWGTPDTKPCVAEICRDKAYDKQTYIRNFDGSVYNEIIEFTFDNEKTGHGYYYIVQKTAPEEARENNERIYFEKARDHFEWKIAQDEKTIAKKEKELAESGEWLTSWYADGLRLDIKIAKQEIENLRDTVSECDELIAERTEKNEDTEAAEKAPENMEGEQNMDIIRFEVGQKTGFSSLYGGWHPVEVTNRTESTVTMRDSWISEDTGRECHSSATYEIEIETIPGKSARVERVQVWEYRGAKGYVYAAEIDEIPDEAPEVTSVENLEEKVYQMLFDCAESVEEFHLDYDRIMNAIADHLDLSDETFERIYDEFLPEWELFLETRGSGEAVTEETEPEARSSGPVPSAKVYKYGKNFFRYDYDTATLTKLYKPKASELREMIEDNEEWLARHNRPLWDIDENGMMEVTSIGFSRENWDNKESRDEYLSVWCDEIEEETAYMVDEFIKYELPIISKG